MFMNIAGGVIRTAVPAILSYMAAKGWITNTAGADDIIAAITTLTALGWSVYNHATTKEIKK